jgi:hypothetical protein
VISRQIYIVTKELILKLVVVGSFGMDVWFSESQESSEIE